MYKTHLLVETTTHLKERVTTEEGCSNMDEVKKYLQSLGFPHWVVDMAVTNKGIDDPTWKVKITELPDVHPLRDN